MLHAVQRPLQAASQQTPSTQNPLLQSLATAHDRPLAVFGTHALLVVSHLLPVAHSPSPVQLVVQASPATLQM
jgi:hypothetical protein